MKRLDSDLLVLSNKYLEELRLLPNSKLSNVHAQVKVCLDNPANSSTKILIRTYIEHAGQVHLALGLYRTAAIFAGNLELELGRRIDGVTAQYAKL